MAKKPAPAAAEVPAMDYPMHNATYENFINMVKWGIAASAVIVVALYVFIELHNALLGWLLLLLIPVGAIVLAITSARRT
jgi:hypothetical protein